MEKKAFREEQRQKQKYLQLIGQAIANLNPEHKCLSRKDIWKFMLDIYGAENTNDKIEYRDFLFQIRKLTGEQKLINTDGYYSLDSMVYAELTNNLIEKGQLHKPIPEYQRTVISTQDKGTDTSKISNHNQKTSSIGRKSANKVTISVTRDNTAKNNVSTKRGVSSTTESPVQRQDTQQQPKQAKLNSFMKLGFDQKKGTPKDLMQGLDPRSKYTPINEVDQKSIVEQQPVKQQKPEEEEPKKPKGFGFITPAPIEKVANSGKQSAVAPVLSHSARKNKQELADIHRQATQKEHQTEIYRPEHSSKTRNSNQYNKKNRDYGKQKQQKMRAAQHKHTISKMSKRIKKTKKTSISYSQPIVHRQASKAQSSAQQSQKNSASQLSPKKISGKSQQMTHPTTQHKRDQQAAKVKVQAKTNTRQGSPQVSNRSSVRKQPTNQQDKNVPSLRSSARESPQKQNQAVKSQTKKTTQASTIIQRSKTISKKKSVSKSGGSSGSKRLNQSIKVNLFGTKRVTLRSSPVQKQKKKHVAARSSSKSRQDQTQQSRISINDNKLSIRKAGEASPEKAQRSASQNITRRRIQPIRKSKAPYSGDRQAKVKAARTMHQMYLNMGLKNKSGSAVKLVKNKKLLA